VLKHLWALFKEHGVEIPYPQRDLRLRQSGELERLIGVLEQGGEPPKPEAQ
jgi:small-conductance mechanosensitive channel